MPTGQSVDELRSSIVAHGMMLQVSSERRQNWHLSDGAIGQVLIPSTDPHVFRLLCRSDPVTQVMRRFVPLNDHKLRQDIHVLAMPRWQAVGKSVRVTGTLCSFDA